MAKLAIPKYLKIHDIQRILRCIFCAEKRPHYIQLNPKPTQIVVALVENISKDFQVKNTIYKIKEQKVKAIDRHEIVQGSKKRLNLEINELENFMSNLGFIKVRLNENVKIEQLYKNFLKHTDITKVNYSCITKENLNLIDKHDIIHMFSYSRCVGSQANFNPDIFETFHKPHKQTEHFLVALDCEMMICKAGKQVGRVSILDHTGKVIYDKFIKPESEVVDYLEQYSGLNYENTSKGISIEEMTNNILDIIGINTVILGHGLENDLENLKLYTKNLIDTSYLFLNTDGHKIKLSNLSKVYFDCEIQTSEHDSREDALCCLKLLSYKISEQLNFLNPKGELMDINVICKEIEHLNEIDNDNKDERTIYFIKNETFEIIPRAGLFYFILTREDEHDYIYFKQKI